MTKCLPESKLLAALFIDADHRSCFELQTLDIDRFFLHCAILLFLYSINIIGSLADVDGSQLTVPAVHPVLV